MPIDASCSNLIRGIIGAAVLAVFNGCGRSGDATGEAVPRNPKEAASQLQQVFSTATPEVKKNADIASDAIRRADYEKAVLSLQIMRSGPNLTLEQGLAIHNSEIAMERKILSAMEGGDENAKRAFQLLKELKRN